MSRSRGKEFVDQRFLHWGTLNMISGKFSYDQALFWSQLIYFNIDSFSLVFNILRAMLVPLTMES